MTGETVHIGNNERLGLSPGSATDSPTLLNAVASHRSLEWSELQTTILYDIETNPKETRHLLLQQRNHIGQSSYHIVYAIDQTPRLHRHLLVNFIRPKGDCPWRADAAA